MRTAIGVFADRNQAEEAIRRLLEHRVPAERISFLTRSESEANSVGKHLEGGRSLKDVGVPAQSTTLSFPGVGEVFVRGANVKPLVELSASGEGRSSTNSAATNAGYETSAGITTEDDDASFFRRVLNDGCSVIIVRSDSHLIAAAACEVLDKMSLGIRKSRAGRSGVIVRQITGAAVATFSGKLAHDEGCLLLRETVRAFLDSGQRRILLNLEQVDFLDSAGLGELVRTHAAVRSRGGLLTLINPAPGVLRILRVTKVDHVFDLAADEFSALKQRQEAAH